MLFNASPSSWIMSWILALQFLISLSLPFTHAAPVSDLVQLSGSVGHETAPLPAASDEYEKYLSKRSPGVTGNAWFIRTRRNGDKVFGFGQDVGSKYLPARQLGSVTVKNRPLGSGSFGTVSEGILFEFDRSRPREKDLEDEPCGYERSNVVVKRGKAKDSYFGGAVQHRLEPGGYVPIVYKDLWIPAGRDYPEGESLVVMERMGKDAFAILSQFPTAFARKEPWALSFSRLYMIKDLVDGLEYAHSNRIIDMDVKLENLMQRIPTARSRSQRFAIIDWDFAIDLSRAQSSWPRKGTPLYAAPEVAKGQYSQWPYAPDVYSAGICLLFAIKPALLDSRYIRDVIGLKNEYRTPAGVQDYLVSHGLLNSGYHFPEVFDLLAKVLCAPQLRLSMAEFGRGLRRLRDLPKYHGELPFVQG